MAARPPTRVRFGLVENAFARPVALALERGLFEEAGLRLEVTRFANGSGTAAALARGELDAAVGGHLQTLGARLEGSGQAFVAPLGFESAPDHLTIAIVASGRNLDGASVGVSAAGAISELQLRIFMRAEGADYETLMLEPMPFDAMADALRTGKVTAVSAPEPLASRLAAEELGEIIDRGSLSGALPPGERAMIVGLVAEPAWVAERPDAARALVAAVHSAAADLEGAGLPHSPLFDTLLEPADLQLVYDLAFEHGLASRRVDPAELILDVG